MNNTTEFSPYRRERRTHVQVRNASYIVMVSEPYEDRDSNNTDGSKLSGDNINSHLKPII